jgi:hypothetical protein
LEQFYGHDFSFQLENADGRGVLVSMNIPVSDMRLSCRELSQPCPNTRKS